MSIKSKVLDALKRSEKAMTIAEIGFNTHMSNRRIHTALNTLMKEHKIRRVAKGQYVSDFETPAVKTEAIPEAKCKNKVSEKISELPVTKGMHQYFAQVNILIEAVDLSDSQIKLQNLMERGKFHGVIDWSIKEVRRPSDSDFKVIRVLK